jgi:hypothetical protein
MPTYFDAVLDVDLNPVFNGTTEETMEWLEQRIINQQTMLGLYVCDGRTLRIISVSEYMRLALNT